MLVAAVCAIVILAYVLSKASCGCIKPAPVFWCTLTGFLGARTWMGDSDVRFSPFLAKKKFEVGLLDFEDYASVSLFWTFAVSMLLCAVFVTGVKVVRYLQTPCAGCMAGGHDENDEKND